MAATCGAQLRHFGETRPVIAPSHLALEMLAAHNEIRARMMVGPLVWSARLAAVAQEWADFLLAHREFEHRSKRMYGENLFQTTGADPHATVIEVVQAWADEVKDYDYKSNGCRRVCGHYTQIVWKDTKQVGCAVARDPFREVWVCNYDPPGNYVGRRPY